MVQQKLERRYFEMCILLAQISMSFEQRYFGKQYRSYSKTFLKISPILVQVVHSVMPGLKLDVGNIFDVFRKKLVAMNLIMDELRIKLGRLARIDLSRPWRSMFLIVIDESMPFTRDSRYFEFKSKYFHIREENKGLMPEYVRLERESRIRNIREEYERRCKDLRRRLLLRFKTIEETIRNDPDLIKRRRVL